MLRTPRVNRSIGALFLRDLHAVAVQDSRNGLIATRAAEMPCVVVVNDYTRHQRLDGVDVALEWAMAGLPLPESSEREQKLRAYRVQPTVSESAGLQDFSRRSRGSTAD